jgi:hypothetical protein
MNAHRREWLLFPRIAPIDADIFGVLKNWAVSWASEKYQVSGFQVS